MELAQSAYLYALAQIAITFGGFTALFMMLRQTVGGKASAMDFFVTQRFLMYSFLVAVGAMLPPLLAAFLRQHDLIWRAASTGIAIPLLVLVVSFPWHRRAVTSRRAPFFIWLRELIHVVAIAILLLNAVGLLGSGPIKYLADQMIG
jgi:hypothetical protein